LTASNKKLPVTVAGVGKLPKGQVLPPEDMTEEEIEKIVARIASDLGKCTRLVL
jgi:hypothetical protein